MSIHAQLSPEAQARLAAQQRNSTITSIIISILVVVLICIVFLFLLLPTVENNTPEIVSYHAGVDETEQVTKRELTRSVNRKPSAPSVSSAKVIAASTISNTAVPIPDTDVPDPSSDFGNGNDFGDGWGSSDQEGGGGGFGGIPATMRERCSKEDRLNRLAKNGGNKQCEDSVVNALRWLNETQNKDGSWCNKKQVAMTGFALLSYLGHCETPNSEEFGDAVTRAIIYLTNVSIQNEGKLASNYDDFHWCYSHSIATYALGEAATFCTKLGINIPNLNKALKMSGDWILNHQHDSGGWDYAYDTTGARGGDSSIALWHIQALKACKHSGLWDDQTFKKPIRKSLDYIKSCQQKDGGISYSPSRTTHGQVGFTMTGGGMLAYQMWGKSHDSLVRKGVRYIKKNAKFSYNTEDSDLYRHYYHAQAMINRGGEDWTFYNNLFRDELLKNQNPNGSWKNVGGGQPVKGSATVFQGGSGLSIHYRTCLATLMLEVYYRFLPATGSR